MKAAPRHPDCSRKRPITTYATPMGFVPFCPWGGGPELGAVTPKFITRPQTRHRRGSIWSASLDGTVTSSQFKAETYVQTPRNGRFPGFWGPRARNPGFWGPRARNPGIRGSGPGNWGLEVQESGNPGQETGNPGEKNPELGPPSPELSDPRTQEPGEEKKSDPPPKKKSSPKKKRPDHITNPPCLQH